MMNRVAVSSKGSLKAKKMAKHPQTRLAMVKKFGMRDFMRDEVREVLGKLFRNYVDFITCKKNGLKLRPF